jgi:hypothetical protein
MRSNLITVKRLVVAGASIAIVGGLTTGVALSQTGGDQPTPPPADAKVLFAQDRIGVADSRGVTRGTIPTSAWRASMDHSNAREDGSADPTPVPVLDDAGKKTGYWIPTYGFVESEVVDAPGFDPDTFVHEEDLKWWNSLTPEQQQLQQEHGVRPPQ